MPTSIDEIQFRMAMLSRELAQFRLKSRLLSVVLAEQHSEEPGPLVIYLSGIAREVEAVIGFVETRLLEASDMTDGAVKGELAAMASGLSDLIRRTAKAKVKTRSSPGIIDELEQRSRKGEKEST